MITIETIKDKGNILAHIFRNQLKADGVKFLTPNEYSLQLGLLEHKKGIILRTHKHNPNIKYKVNTTQEFLYVESGIIEVTYYNNDWKKIKVVKMKSGDFMLHVDGGHGFKILKKARLIEVKQGPYPGEKKAKIYL